jgi:hypothetical protein
MNPDPFQLERAPDLVVGDLRVWICSRQFPDAQDYWDGNWLDIRASVDTGQASVLASGTFLHLGEIKQFHQQVEELESRLTGTAALKPMEPNLQVELVGNGRGQIDVTVCLTHDHLSEAHEFRDGVDQTHLADVIAGCRAILDRYPIRAPLEVSS